jgi:hypothetical protein
MPPPGLASLPARLAEGGTTVPRCRISGYLGLVAAEGGGLCADLVRPGDEAVELVVGDEGEREVMPAELAGYL